MDGMNVLDLTVADAVAVPMGAGGARDYRTVWHSYLRFSAIKALPVVQRLLGPEVPAELPRDCCVKLHRPSKWRNLPLLATRGAWEKRDSDTCYEIV